MERFQSRLRKTTRYHAREQPRTERHPLPAALESKRGVDEWDFLARRLQGQRSRTPDWECPHLIGSLRLERSARLLCSAFACRLL